MRISDWSSDVCSSDLLLPQLGVAVDTLGAYLDAHPPAEAITLLEGSWGEGGDHRVWLNRETEWTWDMAYAAEEDFWTLAGGVAWDRHPMLRRILAQIGRASDGDRVVK